MTGQPPGEYARARVFYREIREQLGPWFREQGYRRVKGTEAGWERETHPGRFFHFIFRCLRGGNASSGGTFIVYVGVEPDVETPSYRSEYLTGWLGRSDVSTLRHVHRTVARRWPHIDAFQPDYEPPRVGLPGLWDDTAEPAIAPHGAPAYLPFPYYDVDDVRRWIEFIKPRLHQVRLRYLTGMDRAR